jgi:hypothetical protein
MSSSSNVMPAMTSAVPVAPYTMLARTMSTVAPSAQPSPMAHTATPHTPLRAQPIDTTTSQGGLEGMNIASKHYHYM